MDSSPTQLLADTIRRIQSIDITYNCTSFTVTELKGFYEILTNCQVLCELNKQHKFNLTFQSELISKLITILTHSAFTEEIFSYNNYFVELKHSVVDYEKNDEDDDDCHKKKEITNLESLLGSNKYTRFDVLSQALSLLCCICEESYENPPLQKALYIALSNHLIFVPKWSHFYIVHVNIWSITSQYCRVIWNLLYNCSPQSQSNHFCDTFKHIVIAYNKFASQIVKSFYMSQSSSSNNNNNGLELQNPTKTYNKFLTALFKKECLNHHMSLLGSIQTLISNVAHPHESLAILFNEYVDFLPMQCVWFQMAHVLLILYNYCHQQNLSVFAKYAKFVLTTYIVCLNHFFDVFNTRNANSDNHATTSLEHQSYMLKSFIKNDGLSLIHRCCLIKNDFTLWQYVYTLIETMCTFATVDVAFRDKLNQQLFYSNCLTNLLVHLETLIDGIQILVTSTSTVSSDHIDMLLPVLTLIIQQCSVNLLSVEHIEKLKTLIIQLLKSVIHNHQNMGHSVFMNVCSFVNSVSKRTSLNYIFLDHSPFFDTLMEITHIAIFNVSKTLSSSLPLLDQTMQNKQNQHRISLYIQGISILDALLYGCPILFTVFVKNMYTVRIIEHAVSINNANIFVHTFKFLLPLMQRHSTFCQAVSSKIPFIKNNLITWISRYSSECSSAAKIALVSFDLLSSNSSSSAEKHNDFEYLQSMVEKYPKLKEAIKNMEKEFMVAHNNNVMPFSEWIHNKISKTGNTFKTEEQVDNKPVQKKIKCQ